MFNLIQLYLAPLGVRMHIDHPTIASYVVNSKPPEDELGDYNVTYYLKGDVREMQIEGEFIYDE